MLLTDLSTSFYDSIEADVLFNRIAGILLRQYSSTAIFNKRTKGIEGKNYTYKILQLPSASFGYNVFEDGKLLIHQPSIPGLTVNFEFQTRADVEKVTRLVIKKLKAGQLPPSIQIKELDELRIKY